MVLAKTPLNAAQCSMKLSKDEMKPYRCYCGKLLFKSRFKPEGLEIKCPKCKAVIEF